MVYLDCRAANSLVFGRSEHVSEVGDVGPLWSCHLHQLPQMRLETARWLQGGNAAEYILQVAGLW